MLFNTDLDLARYAYDPNAEMIINPMVAATSRLLVGGNEVVLVHGIITRPDWNINGVRHQKALSTRLDASTGWVTNLYREIIGDPDPKNAADFFRESMWSVKALSSSKKTS